MRITFLPHVESSFNPEAYSKVGAAGLWQFMRSTGKIFLTVNYLIDERRDPLLSTVAAAKLISANYAELQSWPLAITAYNHGVNGMKRAVTATGSRDFSVILKQYESKSFQFASRNFYACFIAASEIAQNPEQYFGAINYAKPVVAHSLVLPSASDINNICNNLSISKEDFLAINPSLRAIAVAKNKLIPAGYAVRVPLDKSGSSIAVNTLTKAQNQPVFGGAVVDILNGNNLSAKQGILDGQPRLAVKQTDTTKTVSGQKTGVDKSLTSGTTLPSAALPMPKASAPVTTTGVADSTREQTEVRTNVLDRNSIAKIASFDVSVYDLDAVVIDENKASIRISVDETIGHIADWLGISLEKLRAANGIGKSGNVRINKKIIIPATATKLAQFYTTRLEYHMALEEDFYANFYVSDVVFRPLQKGENLWSLCNGEDPIPLWLFKKHNSTLDLTTMFPGMQIAIPVIVEKTEAQKHEPQRVISYEPKRQADPRELPRTWKRIP